MLAVDESYDHGRERHKCMLVQFTHIPSAMDSKVFTQPAKQELPTKQLQLLLLVANLIAEP